MAVELGLLLLLEWLVCRILNKRREICWLSCCRGRIPHLLGAMGEPDIRQINNHQFGFLKIELEKVA